MSYYHASQIIFPQQRAFTYKVIVPPVNLPFSLETLKTHLKITDPDFPDDDYLISIIRAVGLFCEKYTKRTLINTGFRTFRDNFYSYQFILRRSRIQTLDRFEYLVDGVLTPVDPDIFYVTDENDFSRIILLEDNCWPTNGDWRDQSVEIDFTAGYGPDEDDIPDDLLFGMLNHAADIYVNRGDCNNGTLISQSCQSCLSKHTAQIYELYRILDISLNNVN